MPQATDFLLSIILPVLDAEEDLLGLFKSIASQTGVTKENIEIIIINDGSTDTTPKLIKEHRSILDKYGGVRVVNHSERKGLSYTRFHGAKISRGEFITFIDKKCRPDPDYISSFIHKNRNIIIGNPYTDKTKGLWPRALSLVKIKLYYPYFNHPFNDIDLDAAAYARFKNKGGGGSMFVLRKYFLDVYKNMPVGKHVNDDSLLVSKLAEIEPVLKTADAKIEYLNRTGFLENVVHLYNRGPKFVNFYAKPGRRFFMPIVLLVLFIFINAALTFLAPQIILYELGIIALLAVILSVYLAEDIKDFFAALIIAPTALTIFSTGVVRGLLLKLAGKN